MTTYWLRGQKNQTTMNAHNGDRDVAGPSTSHARDSTNPSITLQAPDSPAHYSWAETIRDSNDDSDDENQPSQGALHLKHSTRTSTNNGEDSTCKIADEGQYFQAPVVENTAELSVELQKQRKLIEEIESFTERMTLDDCKEEDDQRTQRSSSNERNHGRVREINGNGNFSVAQNDPTQVVSKGKVRAAVIMFNQRWQHDPNSKNEN